MQSNLWFEWPKIFIIYKWWAMTFRKYFSWGIEYIKSSIISILFSSLIYKSVFVIGKCAWLVTDIWCYIQTNMFCSNHHEYHFGQSWETNWKSCIVIRIIACLQLLSDSVSKYNVSRHIWNLHSNLPHAIYRSKQKIIRITIFFQDSKF